MPSAPIALTVEDQAYRVLSNADPAKLLRLAALVDTQVRSCNPTGRLTPTQALLYAALTLAEQVEQLQTNSSNDRHHTRESLKSILRRIDATIAATDQQNISRPA